MSELPHTPLQNNINRTGGLYDQALEEDTQRQNKDSQDAAFATYEDNITTTQKLDQNTAYTTYADNIQMTQDREEAEYQALKQRRRQTRINNDGGLYDQALEEYAQWQKDTQDAAYTTYEDNIIATQKREQDEAYETYEDNILTTQEREDHEYRELKQERRKAKRKLFLTNLGAAAMWVPGLDVIGDMVQESRSTARQNKERRKKYKQKNGSGSLGSIIRNKYELDCKKNADQRRIIQDLGVLIAEREQNRNR